MTIGLRLLGLEEKSQPTNGSGIKPGVLIVSLRR
jgi:hypothetical protein